MIKFHSRLLGLVLLASLGANALADVPLFSPLAPADAVKLIPPPPSEHSAEARAELESMVAIQEKRTKSEVDRCASEAKLKVDAFQSVLGPWCTSKNLPHTARIFADLAKNSKQYSDTVKSHYRRPRPEHEDQRIHVPIDDETTFAYPSGHATRGMLYALILAEIFPDQRDALLERGREIGWDRVIAGLHHPSDIIAGRVLGQALAHSMLAEQKFQSEFSELKKELTEAEHRAAEPAESR